MVLDSPVLRQTAPPELAHAKLAGPLALPVRLPDVSIAILFRRMAKNREVAVV